MIDPKTSSSGVAYPDDLTLLKKVYDRICQERGIGFGSPQAEQLALRAMGLFQLGVFEEDALCDELRRD